MIVKFLNSATNDHGTDRDEFVKKAVDILMDLNFTMEFFKENLIGTLISEKRVETFNNIDS